jgi:DNA-binding response OmpR family regulator
MRILFAEDDRQLRASIVRGLREASYAVDQASTGPQALALADAKAYETIILDVLLPGMSGTAVCRAIRERGNRAPILMLTALDGVEQRIAGLDAGADDYLTKPFDFGELLARLRALTRRRGEVIGSQLVIGDLVIDTLRRTAWRGAREITLTAKEFAFLLHLARNAGRVVSRAELMAHVWDDTRTTYSNIIDVYASRLRRKVDEGEPVALVTTLRGSGFLLEAPGQEAATRSARPRGKRAARRRE